MAEYIEKDKAINAVFEAFADGRSAYITLEAIPAADVAPVRHGRWERASKSLYACSECGNCVIDERIAGMFYCPNCGAKMDCEEEPFTVETNLYDEEVIHPNCTVQVWRNSQTGEESWGWWENK